MGKPKIFVFDYLEGKYALISSLVDLDFKWENYDYPSLVGDYDGMILHDIISGKIDSLLMDSHKRDIPLIFYQSEITVNHWRKAFAGRGKDLGNLHYIFEEGDLVETVKNLFC